MSKFKTQTGDIPFHIPGIPKPASTWYKLHTDPSLPHPTLITIHGGPGAGHDYLTPLLDLHNHHNLPLLFYDSIGSGKSTHFRDKQKNQNFWTLDLYVRELDNLIEQLGLQNGRGFFLLGHSWGGVVASTYAARQPRGLKKLIIASGPADINLYIKGTRGLLKELQQEVRETIEECEKKGDYTSPKYEVAKAVFLQRHVCRLGTWPQDMLTAFANLGDDPTAYLTLQGPSDFHVEGSMRDWEGWSKAHRIDVPTLLTNGRYDEVQDLCMKPWFDNIPKVEWMKFEDSSHMPHWEERERYMEVVGNFLK